MSDLFNETKYIIDTNVLVDLEKYHPLDLALNIYKSLEKGFESGLIISHIEVYNEVINGFSSDFVNWVKKCKTSFLEHDIQKESIFVSEISEKYLHFVTMRQGSNGKEYINYADPWVIAQAKVRKLTIVTQESKKDNKERIPKIAKELFGIECLSLFDLMRKEGWVF